MNKILVVPIIVVLTSVFTQQSFAASGIIKATPGTGTLSTPTSVSIVVDGGGENFNAAQGTVTVSQNLAVKDITLGDCNFSFITTPTVSNPSFSGAILGGSSNSCTVYTMTLQPLTTGSGKVDISNGSIKSYNGGKELVSSLTGGVYSLNPTNSLPTSTPALQSSTTTSLPSYSLQLRVTDSDNNPLPGVSLTIASPKAGQSELSATTDADGVAHFDNVAPGVHQITATDKNKTLANNIVTASGTNPVIVLGIQEQKNGLVFQWYYLLIIPLLLFIGYLLWQKFHKTPPEQPSWQGQIQ